jgi:hypothetical protein
VNASMSYRHILSFLWLWLLFDINAMVVWLSPYQKVGIKNDDMFLVYDKVNTKKLIFLSQFVQTNIFMLIQNLFLWYLIFFYLKLKGNVGNWP